MAPPRPSNIKSETLHLAAGAPAPKLDDKLLTLYAMKLCPFAQRTRLVLQHKQVPYQMVNLNLKDKCDWFLKMAPAGSVPVLKLPSSSTIIPESLITSEYVEDAYPQKPLYPKDPVKKAMMRIAVDKMSSNVIPAIYRWAGAAAQPQQQKEEFAKLLEQISKLQENLQGGKYFTGSPEPLMADFMIWPWFERLPVMMKVFGVDFPAGKFDALKQWMKNMEQLPAVMQTKNEPDIHEQFLKSMAAGNPKYDY